MAERRRPRSLQHWISASLVMFGLLMAAGSIVQGYLSQRLILHPVWQQILESTMQGITDSVGRGPPTSGALRGWALEPGQPPPPDMPAFLATLEPGYYDESTLDGLDKEPGFLSSVVDGGGGTSAEPAAAGGTVGRDRSYAALVEPSGEGRLVLIIDMTDIESQQNIGALLSILYAVSNLLLIGIVIGWLYCSLARPVKDLARRMRQLDPGSLSARLPIDYRQTELNTIAAGANMHLDRVERQVERERRLLDQASHEFRTPLTVIAGAADVLHKQSLPDRAQRPLQRIDEAVTTLVEIMEALLYLAQDPLPGGAEEITLIQALLPRLISDHEYLLEGKPVRFETGSLEPRIVHAPEAMVRIAAGNLIRNAAEHTHEGGIGISLTDGVMRIEDSGEGFDTDLAARRYAESLQRTTQAGSGVGLGIFLTRRICERFGWILSLDSSRERGTVASIDFNAREAPRPR